MEIVQIVAFALIAAFLSMVTRAEKPIFSMLIATAAGVIIFLRMAGYLAAVLQYLVDMTLEANISLIYLNTLLKIIGIAYIAEFGAQVCRDAGEGVIAAKVEFAAKILMLVMALPLLGAVLETILNFIP